MSQNQNIQNSTFLDDQSHQSPLELPSEAFLIDSITKKSSHSTNSTSTSSTRSNSPPLPDESYQNNAMDSSERQQAESPDPLAVNSDTSPSSTSVPKSLNGSNATSSLSSFQSSDDNNTYNQLKKGPISRFTLITTDSGNPLYVDPTMETTMRLSALPVATTQGLLNSSIGEGVTSINRRKFPIVFEQFNNLTFSVFTNPRSECKLLSEAVLRRYLHDLYHLIHFRLGPQFFDIVLKYNQRSQKAVQPVITNLVKALTFLYDSHVPTLLGEFERVELDPLNLLTIKKCLLDSVGSINSKSIQSDFEESTRDISGPINSSQLSDAMKTFPELIYGSNSSSQGFVSHAILMVKDSFVVAEASQRYVAPSSSAPSNTSASSPALKRTGSFFSRFAKKTHSAGLSRSMTHQGAMSAMSPAGPVVSVVPVSPVAPIPPASPNSSNSSGPLGNSSTSSPSSSPKPFRNAQKSIDDSALLQKSAHSPAATARRISRSSTALPNIAPRTPNARRSFDNPNRGISHGPASSAPGKDSATLPRPSKTRRFQPQIALNSTAVRHLIMLAHAKYQLKEDAGDQSQDGTIFLERVFLQCTDGITRKVYCYLRDLGNSVYLALVCRPMTINQQRITKSSAKKIQNQIEIVRVRCHKTANYVLKNISGYLAFLHAKGLHQKMHLAKFFIKDRLIPCLAHFCFVDRTHHQVIQPQIVEIPRYDANSATPGDAPPISKESIRLQVQRLFSYSLTALSEGHTHLIIRRGPFIFSYRLWAERIRGYPNRQDHSIPDPATKQSLSTSLSRSLSLTADSLRSMSFSTPVSGTYLVSRRYPVVNPPKKTGLVNPDVADSKMPPPRFLDFVKQRHQVRFDDVDLSNNLNFPGTIPTINYKRLVSTWFPHARDGDVQILELFSLYISPPSMVGRSDSSPTNPTLPIHGVVFRDQLLLNTLRGHIHTS